MGSQPIDDSFEARVSASCPDYIREILYHAWSHDVSGLEPLIDAGEHNAKCRDPITGETPLHAAIRSCGQASGEEDQKSPSPSVEQALRALNLLFQAGAIWNDVDDHDETPGCVASRLGQEQLYNLCIVAGCRAELVFRTMQELFASEEDDEDDEDDDGDEGPESRDEGGDAVERATQIEMETEAAKETKGSDPRPPTEGSNEVTSEAYLNSTLTYSEGKLVDDQGNGVMMAWETEIMRRSVNSLLPGLPAGKRILNVGLGMGIIDSMFAETQPCCHHIIEAHPDVLKHLSQPNAKFGSAWESAGPSPGAFKVYPGTWQSIVPSLAMGGTHQYDAIYFDTFGEDYSQLRLFFTEYVPLLLADGGRFSFFNGLGADRKICHDVYRQISSADLKAAHFDLEWDEMDVNMEGLEEAGKGEWEGVRRRYWTLDKYWMPICIKGGQA